MSDETEELIRTIRELLEKNKKLMEDWSEANRKLVGDLHETLNKIEKQNRKF